jgi:hypothetical protein
MAMATAAPPSEVEAHPPAFAPTRLVARFLEDHRVQLLAEWLVVAWALWWSWAYVRSALGARFPEWFSWTSRLW